MIRFLLFAAIFPVFLSGMGFFYGADGKLCSCTLENPPFEFVVDNESTVASVVKANSDDKVSNSDNSNSSNSHTSNSNSSISSSSSSSCNISCNKIINSQ